MPKGYTAARPFKRDGSPGQVAILERQLRGLRSMEDSSPEYREMLAAADARRLAGGDYAHGWGAFSATGDSRKQRKAAS